MNETYLKFYSEDKGLIHESELPENFDFKYLRHKEDGYYELLKNHYIGKVDKRNNFAFLLQKEEDLYINPNLARDLMNDDIILLINNKRNPQIIILKRGLEFIIATVKARKRGFKYFTDKPLRRNILVDDERLITDGSIVKLKVDNIKGERIYASLDKIIGHITDPNIDILKIVATYDWPETDFDLLEKEANNLNVNVEEEKKFRLDLTNELTVTIDGADAKDLDDAISLEFKDDLYHLGVHIADVSLYVKRGSIIDKSAYEKSTSAYLADSVIPMLPRKLANDLCSLNPNTDKLTLSCLMTINKEGRVVDYRIEKTVINTKFRLTYDQVNNYLNENINLETKELDTMLTNMNDLSNILSKVRAKRGSLDFKSEELKFVFDEDYNVTDVIVRKSDKGEELIESFMLMANETVAFHMEKNHFPSIYRVHEKPEEAKLEQAKNTISSLGIETGKTLNPKGLQKILKTVEGSNLEHIVNMFLLRAMQKAHYDQNPIGHFGLGARYYTHFTSPIRRYPDLLLHRIIKELVFGENNNKRNYAYYESHLEEISKHTSKMERVAIDMERDVDSLMAAKYMINKIDDEFSAQIVQVLKTGFFVKLDNGIEGFVNVKLNYFNYEYNEVTLSHKIHGTLYKIGDKVEVKLVDVNILEREIDFVLV